jgi:hypothetical protein
MIGIEVKPRMPKKLTWEVDKASLVLKVTDGAKETTWKLRKTSKIEDVSQVFEDIWVALQDTQTLGDLANRLIPELPAPVWDGRPMLETASTVDAEELAELQRYKAVQATSEEASRAAQAARVHQLNIGAKWFEADDDETYGIPIPDYDTGEV